MGWELAARAKENKDHGFRYVRGAYGFMLRQRRLKKYARMYLMSRALKNYTKTTFDDAYQYWQAGKGVGSIKSVEPVSVVVQEFRETFEALTYPLEERSPRI